MTDTQTLLDKDVQIEELARRVEVLEGALRPFDAMAGELFAMNYNRTDVPFSLVGDDGVLRLSAGDFFDVRAALSTPSVGGSLAEENERLREALDGIYIYANDTLSGRVDGGPDDREWQRAAVVEIRNRARVFATAESAVDARAALTGKDRT